MNGDGLRVSINVRIDVSGQAGYGNLEIREDFPIPVGSFMELAQVLGRFHELAEKIKAEQG